MLEPASRRRRVLSIPSVVAVVYAVFGAFWILLSDRLVLTAARSPQTIARLQTCGRWGFVAATAVLLYVLLRLHLAARRRDEAGRERALEEQRRVEESGPLKSTFLSAMSHELRTPLNAIIGFTGMLVEGLTGPLNDEQLKQMRIVQASGRHLLVLIDDVLDVSRIQTGRIKLTEETFCFSELVDEALATVADEAKEKGLTLTADIASDIDELTSDRRRVAQILSNLLSNAVKFTTEGEVRLEAGVERGALIVHIEDTGVGIRAEDMEKLFGTFSQLDAGRGVRQPGTGLGLHISKRLAELLGGTVTAESERNVGSTFTLELPLH
ncbi:hypothetical protein K8S17_04305 [bacterium]|nr:hypothetical protein [bacterium]